MPIKSAALTIVDAAAALLIVALTVYLLVVGQPILLPLVVAIFIAYLILALAHRLERLPYVRLPSWLALTLAIVLLMLGIAGLVQLLADNIQAVVAAAPEYQERLQSLFNRFRGLIARAMRTDEPLTVGTLLERVNVAVIVAGVAGAFQSIAGNTFQILAYVVFLLLETRTLPIKLRALAGDKQRQATLEATLSEMGAKIEAYVFIKTVVSLSVGVVSYGILRLFGVDFAAFWGLLIFALNYIPFIGTPVAIFFPTVLTVLQYESFGRAALVLGCLIGVQLVTENLIEPRFTGKSLNLSPVVIMLSLAIWGSIWGITGMILSVPLMVMLMIVLAQFPRTRPLAILMSERGEVR